ncbi:MAG TPA: PP2C family protein-serine/threonine phosphatase [Ornithinibacter sp.]|nr:PP2C family protein-serine/threonine phosphatase [Ornithinibacter sp.]
MSEPDRPEPPSGADGLSLGERGLDALLERAGGAAPHELPRFVTEAAATLGALEVMIHLVDLQQVSLTPFPEQASGQPRLRPTPLPIDATIAGRVYQHDEVIVQPGADAGSTVTVWLPLRDGADRLGVLSVVVPHYSVVAEPDTELSLLLRRLAAIVSDLIALRTKYGDAIVAARRTTEVGLAAEIQWGLLPPLTFESPQVAIAGLLEPAYDVAGDSIDYAVDPGVARIAIFDGMGHGLASAQLAILSVSAYRNARRSGCSLTATASAVDQCVEAAFGGDAYSTAVLAELDTETGHLTWVNAGHPEPLLLRSGQLVRSLHVAPGLPFGIGLHDADHCYGVGTDQLEPGDHVLFYTDGVVEGHSPDGEQFGVERLVDLLARNVAESLSAAESMRRVGRALIAHHAAHLADDASMLLVQWPGPLRDAG